MIPNWMMKCETTLYRPFRTGACVATSFFLLGILEERGLLSLLSLCRLITEVGGGFSVILIISTSSTSCRVYPPVASTVSLLL